MIETFKSWYHSLHETLQSMLHWVEGLSASPYGTLALFAIAFAESSFFPIPPDVLLIALCLGDPSKALWFALVCSVASILGGMLGYGIGHAGGRPVLDRLVSKSKIAAVSRYYDRYNAWATGIAGLTPIPYKVFTIAGGAFSINFRIFVLASIVSRSLRFFAVALIVRWLGEPAKQFIDENLALLSIAFVVTLIIGFFVISRVGRRAGRDAEDPSDTDDDHGAAIEATGEPSDR